VGRREAKDKIMDKPVYRSCGNCKQGMVTTPGGGAVPCSCLKEHLKNVRLYECVEEANIPVRYINCTVDNFEAIGGDSNNIKIRQCVGAFVNNLKVHLEAGNGYIFMGDNNSGKTHLAVAILMAALEAGYSAYFTMLTSYINIVTRSWTTRDPEDIYLRDQIREAKVVCLDDIDKLAIENISFKEEILDEFLRYRVNNCLSTILTTNISDTGGLFKLLGGSIVNLLKRCNVEIYFKGSYDVEAKRSVSGHIV